MENKPMTNNLLSWTSALVAIVLIVGTVSMYPTPGMGKAYAATSTKVPFDTTFTPTGPGCENAEDIHLTGTLNIVTTTANGKTIRQFHPQGITGVGETTGTTYRGTGGTIIIGDPTNDGKTHTYVNNFNIIATKPAGISSIEHLVLHITVNAQGEITADVQPTEHNSCR
jgi:hypothetical protein